MGCGNRMAMELLVDKYLWISVNDEISVYDDITVNTDVMLCDYVNHSQRTICR